MNISSIPVMYICDEATYYMKGVFVKTKLGVLTL